LEQHWPVDDFMTADELKRRTKSFALRVCCVVNQFPTNRSSGVIGNQLLRSATSVGANCRAACRARSPAEFVAKLGIVEEEADESAYWLEMLIDLKAFPEAMLMPLQREAEELTAIVVASIRTARLRIDPKRR